MDFHATLDDGERGTHSVLPEETVLVLGPYSRRALSGEVSAYGSAVDGGVSASEEG